MQDEMSDSHVLVMFSDDDRQTTQDDSNTQGASPGTGQQATLDLTPTQVLTPIHPCALHCLLLLLVVIVRNN